jgi:hypothetical protein
MKFFALFTIAAFSGMANAWYGQLAAGPKRASEGPIYQDIYLTDYATGSTYTGTLVDGFDACTRSQCPVE